METTHGHVGKMEAQWQQWGARLDQLVAKAEAAGSGAKADYQSHLEELKAKCHVARGRLVALKAAGGENWETFKSLGSDNWETFKAAGGESWETFKVGLESTWEELEAAYKKLTN
jgi:hypothetical protein